MKKTFVDQLREDFIPWLEKDIIPKEEAHIQDLELQKAKLIYPSWWVKLLPGYHLSKQTLIDHVDSLIAHNKKQLNHFRLRLKEYKEYVQEYESSLN